MRFRGKVELADVDDARKLILGKFYWARFVIYPFVIGSLIGWIGVTVWGWHNRNWFAVGSALFVTVLFIALHYCVDREKERELKRLNATLAEWITVLPDGVRFEEADGVTVFIPWVHYKTYQEGERVIWVKPPNKGQGTMLPISSLSDIDKQALRDQLAAALPRTVR